MFTSRREIISQGVAAAAFLSLPIKPAEATPVAVVVAAYVGQKLLDGALEYAGGANNVACAGRSGVERR